MKKILVLTLVLAMGIGTATAFADTPSEILEDLSGVTQEQQRDARDEGKTLRDLAEENGVTDEFNSRLMADYAERIAELVSEGRITDEVASERISDFNERIEDGEFAQGMRAGKRGNGFERGDRTEREPLLDEDTRETIRTQMDTYRDAAMNQLVTEGLITQEVLDEVEALIADREVDENGRPERLNLRDIVSEEAMEQFKIVMDENKEAVIDQLVEDGVIDADTAEQMKERAENRGSRQDGEQGQRKAMGEKTGLQNSGRGNGQSLKAF